MILVVYLVSVLTIYTFLRLFKFTLYQWRLYQQMKSLPGPEITNPIAGNLSIMQEIVAERKNVAKKFYDKMTELSDLYGRKYGFFRLWLGPFTPWIIVCDAKLARRVLTSPKFTSKATYYRMMESFATGSSLFTLSAPEARRERKVLKEHFTLKYLETYVSKTEFHLKAFVKQLDSVVEKENGYYPDINHLVSSFIYDTVGDNLFSAHFTSITTGEEPPYLSAIHEMITWLEVAILQPWRYLAPQKALMFLINLFNHMTFSYTIYAFRSIARYQLAVWDIVKARYDQLVIRDSGKKRFRINWKLVDTEKPSLLDSLLLNRVLLKKESQGANVFSRSWNFLSSFVDVMWHADMFIVAGHDTTTASISWTLYSLAHHLEVQERAREEVFQYLEDLKNMGEVPNVMNLKRLPYLECCIKEALRLHPVAPFLGRLGQAELPVSVDGTSIPAQVDVTVFYDYAHRQEKYFPNSHEYKPERYMGKTNFLTTFDLDAQVDPNRASFPFSLGERNCLGQQYAMSQMKLLLVRLLSNFEIHSLPEEENVVDEHHFLTKPPRFPVKIVKLKV